MHHFKFSEIEEVQKKRTMELEELERDGTRPRMGHYRENMSSEKKIKEWRQREESV